MRKNLIFRDKRKEVECFLTREEVLAPYRIGIKNGFYAGDRCEANNESRSGVIISKHGIRYDVLRGVGDGSLWYKLTNSKHQITQFYLDYNVYMNMTSVPLDPKYKGFKLDTDASRMFMGLRALTEVPLLEVSNVTNMRQMFHGCEKLAAIPEMDTHEVRNMDYMFMDCKSIKTIPVLDTSNVTTMVSLFAGCGSLQSVPDLDTGKVTDMSGMFSSCRNMGSFPDLNTDNVKSMRGMFTYCSFKSAPVYDTGNVTDLAEMFVNCGNLVTGPKLDTRNAENFASMFYNCYQMTSVPYLETKNAINLSNMFAYCSALKTAPYLKTTKAQFMNGMFNGCRGLTSVGIIDFLAIVDKESKFPGEIASIKEIAEHLAVELDCTDKVMSDFEAKNYSEPLHYMAERVYEIREKLGEEKCAEISDEVNRLLGWLSEVDPYEAVEDMFYGCNSLKSVQVTNISDGILAKLKKDSPNIRFEKVWVDY